MIEQAVWREGLPDPSYDRIFTTVHNVIVHHSAGSNTDTNYTGIVRNIYIYHTEIRGWSDIGYNYLVAPDGVIFKGRDPGTLEQDNVLGAHFCSSNSGTMGICVMGTYTEIQPTPAALASLIALVNWKLGRDSLDPAGIYPHVLHATLPVIAGHRDGCATECPGERLYHLLDSLRHEVQDAFESCGYTVKPIVTGIKRQESSAITISYGAEAISVKIHEGQIRQFQLHDILGHEITPMNWYESPHEVILSAHGMKPGIYLIKIRCNEKWYTDKIIFR